MREKIATIVLLLILVLPLVVAIKTDITVKTEPNYIVSIFISDPISEDEIHQISERADASGLYTDSFSTDLKEVNIEIVSQNNDNVILGKYEVLNYEAGEPITLDFTKKETVEENQTEEPSDIEEGTFEEETEEETLEEDSQETEEPGITGEAVQQPVLGENVKKIIFYVVGALILVVIAGFVVARSLHKNKMAGGSGNAPKEIKVKKFSEIQAATGKSSTEEDPRVAAAEAKIREAQQELKRIKNDEKIKSLEKQIEDDRQMLERLKSGEE